MAKKKSKKRFNFLRRKKGSPKLPIWAVSRRFKQKKELEDEDSAPRITNDTVAEHREEVLSGAKRFTYPLQHSRHRVVIISSIIVVVVLISSLLTSGLLLYRYKSTSNFAYRVTQVIPFPVAKVDGKWVPYEDYLFEVRTNLFYTRNHGQEEVDIDSDAGRELETQLQQRALEKVKLDALARKIAYENDIMITDEEVDEQIARIRLTEGVGESDEVLEDIISNFYNWDMDDLRKSIEIQLVRQKLPRALDVDTVQRAERALKELKEGTRFGELAEKYSDDKLTAENNGVIGLISRTNTDLPVEFVEAAFNLEEGSKSELVETRFGLHIIFNRKTVGDEVEVAHILFRYFDITEYLQNRLNEVESSDYINFE